MSLQQKQQNISIKKQYFSWLKHSTYIKLPHKTFHQRFFLYHESFESFTSKLAQSGFDCIEYIFETAKPEFFHSRHELNVFPSIAVESLRQKEYEFFQKVANTCLKTTLTKVDLLPVDSDCNRMYEKIANTAANSARRSSSPLKGSCAIFTDVAAFEGSDEMMNTNIQQIKLSQNLADANLRNRAQSFKIRKKHTMWISLNSFKHHLLCSFRIQCSDAWVKQSVF